MWLNALAPTRTPQEASDDDAAARAAAWARVGPPSPDRARPPAEPPAPERARSKEDEVKRKADAALLAAQRFEAEQLEKERLAALRAEEERIAAEPPPPPLPEKAAPPDVGSPLTPPPADWPGSPARRVASPVPNPVEAGDFDDLDDSDEDEGVEVEAAESRTSMDYEVGSDGGLQTPRMVEFFKDGSPPLIGGKDVDFDVDDSCSEEDFVPRPHAPMTYEEIIANSQSPEERLRARPPGPWNGWGLF